ncbi:MAG: hypothetical protein ACLR78_06750 [Roseburia sp.]
MKRQMYTEKNGEIEFAAEYQEEIPFFETVLGKQTETVAVKRRSWIGIPGKLKGDGTSQDGDGDEQTEMVYVRGRNREISPVPGLPLYFE